MSRGMTVLIQAGVGVAIGLAVAGVLSALLHLHHGLPVRRFRRQLRQVELVVMIWEQSTGVAEPRRARRRRRPSDAG